MAVWNAEVGILQDDGSADVAAIQRIEAVRVILDVVRRVTGMRFAAIARVTDENWIACAVRDELGLGLQPGDGLELQTTICHSVRKCREAVVIDHVAQDEIYRDHPTPALYGFQSYISVPIVRADGSMFGTLCALDSAPARVNTPETIATFKLFAELIALHLDTGERLASSEATLVNERHTSELREQFIAVLGHDLRNPLASIAAGARLLSRPQPPEKANSIVEMVLNSVDRMTGLIDNVLDFASGRLGGGLSVNRTPDHELEPALIQVVEELRASWPNRVIETEFDLAGPVNCDRGRLAQLLSNLLSNALRYGAEGAPVRVAARLSGPEFVLSVVNSGDPIPPAARERLFLPFTRGAAQTNQRGLGLGLYIASEIARAHEGKIEVASSAQETRFTFRMPRG
jgi:signal transduction histidine kinase